MPVITGLQILLLEYDLTNLSVSQLQSRSSGGNRWRTVNAISLDADGRGGRSTPKCVAAQVDAPTPSKAGDISALQPKLDRVDRNNCD